MKYCNHCGAEIKDEAVVCIKCGCNVASGNKAIEDPNESTALYGVLGFFIPIAGLILFLMWQKDYPRRSKAAGKGALASVILGVVLLIVYIIVIVAVVGSTM